MNHVDFTFSERLPDESDEAYARFLLYLHLGPGRSIEAAYRLYYTNRTSGAKAKNGDRRRRSGQWERDSRTYHWKERASKWDVKLLTSLVPGSIARILHAIDQMALRTVQMLESDHVKPKTWGDLLNAVSLLGSVISPEVIASLVRTPDESNQ